MNLPLHYSIKKIVLTNHAFLRWCQRIAPKADRYFLNTLFLDLLRLKRIRFIDEDTAIIDEDIIFNFLYDSKDKDILVVQTFIGRVSLKTLIMNKEYVQNRYVFLNVEKNIIAKQKIPSITKYERLQIDETNEQLHFNQLSKKDKKVATWNLGFSFIVPNSNRKSTEDRSMYFILDKKNVKVC